MIITIDSKDYDWRGEYRRIGEGDFWLGQGGHVAGPGHDSLLAHNNHISRAIIHPIPVRHTFGGGIFKETGEVRPAKPGEWILFDKVPVLIQLGTRAYFSAFPILKLVEIV